MENVYLTNYALKGHKKTMKEPTHPLMQDLNESLSMIVGYSTYDTAQNVFRLDDMRTTQRGRSSDSISFGPGQNKYAITVLAPARFEKELLSNNGDGTRGRREAVKYIDADSYPWIIGMPYPPDFSDWPDDPGIPMPVYLDDLLLILGFLSSKACLSSEFDTELLVSISNPKTPMLVHTIYPEPHSGKSSKLHLKMWLGFIQSWHEAKLCVCVFNNDCCSTGLGATKLLMTVTSWMIAKGVVYVGLAASDFQYMAPLLEPRYDDPSVPSGSFVPPGKFGALDVSHHVRSGRRTAKDEKRCVTFYSEKSPEGVETVVYYTTLYLQELARDRRFKGKYNLHEMCTFDDFMDQKGDAAWHFHSWKLFHLLKRERPQDRGTLLGLQATYYLTAPYKIAEWTDPFSAVFSCWRGLAIWEVQEMYIIKLIKKFNLTRSFPSISHE